VADLLLEKMTLEEALHTRDAGGGRKRT